MTTAQFIHFRNNGHASPDTGLNVPLGPATDQRMRNAMELCFRLSVSVPQNRVRFRRTLHERVWQNTRHRTTPGTGYELLFELGPGFPDDPPLGLGLDSLPLCFDVDLPGFNPFWRPSTRQIRLTDTTTLESRTPTRLQMTDRDTSELIFKRNFTQWLEVLQGRHWRRVSTRFRWHDTLHIHWATARWRVGPLTKIKLGTMPLNPS